MSAPTRKATPDQERLIDAEINELSERLIEAYAEPMLCTGKPASINALIAILAQSLGEALGHVEDGHARKAAGRYADFKICIAEARFRLTCAARSKSNVH